MSGSTAAPQTGGYGADRRGNQYHGHHAAGETFRQPVAGPAGTPPSRQRQFPEGRRGDTSTRFRATNQTVSRTKSKVAAATRTATTVTAMMLPSARIRKRDPIKLPSIIPSYFRAGARSGKQNCLRPPDHPSNQSGDGGNIRTRPVGRRCACRADVDKAGNELVRLQIEGLLAKGPVMRAEAGHPACCPSGSKSRVDERQACGTRREFLFNHRNLGREVRGSDHGDHQARL